MTDQHETGGPAFAMHSPESGTQNGMTLRDYFAAKAMQAAFTGAAMRSEIPCRDTIARTLARVSYMLADAML